MVSKIGPAIIATGLIHFFTQATENKNVTIAIIATGIFACVLEKTWRKDPIPKKIVPLPELKGVAALFGQAYEKHLMPKNGLPINPTVEDVVNDLKELISPPELTLTHIVITLKRIIIKDPEDIRKNLLKKPHIGNPAEVRLAVLLYSGFNPSNKQTLMTKAYHILYDECSQEEKAEIQSQWVTILKKFPHYVESERLMNERLAEERKPKKRFSPEQAREQARKTFIELEAAYRAS